MLNGLLLLCVLAIAGEAVFSLARRTHHATLARYGIVVEPTWRSDVRRSHGLGTVRSSVRFDDELLVEVALQDNGATTSWARCDASVMTDDALRRWCACDTVVVVERRDAALTLRRDHDMVQLMALTQAPVDAG